MARKKEIVKDILTIAGGGLVEVFVEILADTYLPQANIIPGPQPYNTGDAVGALEATLVTVVGIYKEKPRLLQLGAGGFAVAVPNFVGKALINSVMPIGTTATFGFNNGNGGQGRYGRNVSLPPMTIVAPKYARR